MTVSPPGFPGSEQASGPGMGAFVYQVLQWFAAATPAWLALCLLAACAALFWQQRQILRRLDRHAESIAHMDAWADEVDTAITGLEEKSRRVAPAYVPPRSTPPVDTKKWWQK